MSLETPTTSEISSNIVAQLETSLNQTIPLLPKSFLRVLAKALAAVFILLYKYGGFIFLQLFVSSASAVPTTINGRLVTPLNEWGKLVGIDERTPATQAELLIDVTVEVQAGTLDSGTQLVNTNNGVTYIVTGSVLLDAPIIQATIQAASDQSGGDGSGAIGNLEPGAIVSFVNTPSNVARDTVVDSQIVTGADAEDIEVYRQRILDKFQKRPQGGAYADYEQWAEETAGIVNAYPYTSDCPGQVDVYLEATPESSGSPDGIPTPAQLQAALDLINFDANGLATRRPANALANTFPITRLAFTVNVFGIQDVDNLAEVEAAVQQALIDDFLDKEPFIEGLSIPPRKSVISRSSASGVVDDIVSAAGGVFLNVQLTLNASTIEIYELGIGEKAKAETVNFL